MSTDERVNHPDHYNRHPSGTECIDVVEHMTFNLGNAVKYIWRAGWKSDLLEDLRKARWYIDREIQRMEAKRVTLCEECGWVGKAEQIVDGKCPRACATPLKYFLDLAA